MKTFVFSLVLLTATVSLAETVAPTVPEQLQDVSCTIIAGKARGSGTLIQREDKTFVLTAAHVVAQAFKDKQDVSVMVLLRKKDRTEMGRKESVARIFAYSADHDIAILLVKEEKLNHKLVKFYAAPDPPKVGSEIWHCGTFLGEFPQSISKGVISAVGSLDDGVVFDQADVCAYPGSSGGGVFNKKGEYLGMLVSGTNHGGNLHWFVPMRRIRDWTVERKMEWLFNTDLKVPSKKELKKVPQED